MKIPVYKPYLEGNYKKYALSAINSTWISSRGEFLEKFENEFSNYLGREVFSTSVSNGTVALDLALRILGIGPGDEVLVPNFTYIATVNAVVRSGAKPVFVDCDKNNWNINTKTFSKLINKRTRAIIAVHIYGSICNMPEILEIKKKYNIYIIEDAAEALGSSLNGKKAGTFGDVATFSFFGNKTITTGEGGMVSSQNSKLIKKAKHLKSQACSQEKEYWHDDVGYNFRMTNIQAAIGLSQIEIIDDILKKKNNIFNLYTKLLKNYPVKFQNKLSNSYSSRWMNACQFESQEILKLVRENLKNHGIETRRGFPLLTDFPMFSDNNYDISVGRNISDTSVCLPSYPSLTNKNIEKIVNLITMKMEKV